MKSSGPVRRGRKKRRAKITVERIILLILAMEVCIVWRSSTLLSSHIGEQAPTGLRLLWRPPTNHAPDNSGNHSSSRDDPAAMKPYFVWHIGPPKTATTFIQCNLHMLSKDLADDDAYYFIGKICPRSKSKKMENNETDIHGHLLLMGLNDRNGVNPRNRGYEALQSRLDYHRRAGHHMIYSNEAFGAHLVNRSSTWECLRTLLEGWHVRVVVGYRHYFDWIRSFYYETNRISGEVNKWPGQGQGRPHPSFLEFLERHLRRKEAGDLSVATGGHHEAWGHHLAISAYTQFRPHFADVRFLDLYDEEDTFTDFVCRMLPNAERTCAKLRNGTYQGRRARASSRRASKSFDAVRIAEAALTKGYISLSSNKGKVIRMVDERLNEIGKELLAGFAACPPPSLVERLLKVSLAYEHDMLDMSRGDASASARKAARDAHVAMYRRDEAEGRFCDLDPESILGDEAWVAALSEIGKATSP